MVNDNGLVASGTLASGGLGLTGGGTRMVWAPYKGAFRAGHVNSDEWDDANVGLYSVAMGYGTRAVGEGSVALGYGATATSDYGVALGYLADTNGSSGSFVFSDASTNANFTASAGNEFSVRAAGGVRFFTSSGLTSGVYLQPGGGSWDTVSDARLKENYRDLSGEAVLQKLAGIPIREWNYRAQPPAIRHVGPTAQDFHAAFGLGGDPHRINTGDADGIALAGVQALDVRTRATAETVKREADLVAREMAQLRAEIAYLRTLVQQLAAERR